MDMSTHASECNESYRNFQYHRRVDDDLKDVEWESWAFVHQAEDDGGDRQCRHAEVEEYVRPRVHKAVGESARNLAAGERIY